MRRDPRDRSPLQRRSDALPESSPVPADADDTVDDGPRRFAASLGLEFRDLELLRLALTHRSVLHDWAAATEDAPPPPPDRQSNERLEFLGDSVLGYLVADLLYARYPEATEGELTAKRASLVRAERLVRWAREIGLADALYLGVNERVSDGARDRMLAGGFEAVIGALALDRGLRETRRFLRRFVDRDEAEIAADLRAANPKGRLQEAIQERFKLPPVYRTLDAEGPAHARIFTAEVSVDGRPLGVGSGGSKRAAEEAAATVALAALPPEDAA